MEERPFPGMRLRNNHYGFPLARRLPLPLPPPPPSYPTSSKWDNGYANPRRKVFYFGPHKQRPLHDYGTIYQEHDFFVSRDRPSHSVQCYCPRHGPRFLKPHHAAHLPLRQQMQTVAVLPRNHREYQFQRKASSDESDKIFTKLQRDNKNCERDLDLFSREVNSSKEEKNKHPAESDRPKPSNSKSLLESTPVAPSLESIRGLFQRLEQNEILEMLKETDELHEQEINRHLQRSHEKSSDSSSGCGTSGILESSDSSIELFQSCIVNRVRSELTDLNELRSSVLSLDLKDDRTIGNSD